MDVRHESPARDVKRRVSRVRTRAETGDGGFFPDVQLGSTGSPISIVDGVVSAIIIAVALAVIEKSIGGDPTKIV